MLFDQVIVESRLIEVFEECDSDGNGPMLKMGVSIESIAVADYTKVYNKVH